MANLFLSPMSTVSSCQWLIRVRSQAYRTSNAANNTRHCHISNGLRAAAIGRKSRVEQRVGARIADAEPVAKQTFLAKAAAPRDAP